VSPDNPDNEEKRETMENYTVTKMQDSLVTREAGRGRRGVRHLPLPILRNLSLGVIVSLCLYLFMAFCLLITAAQAQTMFIDEFDNQNYIDPASIMNITFDSGLISPNGSTFGELKPEPTMEALFHLNGNEPYVHDPVYTRGSYDSSEKGRHAVWQIIKDYTRPDNWLFPDEGKFGNSYSIYKNAKTKFFFFTGAEMDQNNFTFAFWIKSTSDFANHAPGDFWIFGGTNSFLLRMNTDNLTLASSGVYLRANNLGWKAGEWHHIAGVINPQNSQLWVDGMLKASSAMTIANFSYLRVGWSNNNLNTTGNVSIDELALWNHALGADEIAALAQAKRINTGEFKSSWIEMGQNYNSLKPTLNGASLDNVKISLTCDDLNWQTVKNEQWADYRHYNLPSSRFKYRINFYGDPAATIENIRWDWKNTAESDSFTFAFYGDSTEKGSGVENELTHRRLTMQIEKIDPDLTFNTGDMVDRPSNSRGANETMWQSFLRTTEKLRNRKSLGLDHGMFGSIGNHESLLPHTGYFEAFNYSPIYSTVQSWNDTLYNPEDPANPGYYQNMYYSFKYKGVCFISLYYYDGDHCLLYSNQAKYIARDYSPVNIHDLSTASRQYKWLYATLKEASEDPSIRWKVVFFHNPPYGLGAHSASDNISEIRARQVTRQFLSPLFEYFGVNLVDSGHDHLYVRTHPIISVHNPSSGYFDGEINATEGIVYIDAALGGEDGMCDAAPVVNPVPAWAATWYGRPCFVKVTVNDNSLIGETINFNGDVVDTFTITKTAAIFYGDVSNDDEVSVYDAALVAQASVGIITLTAEQTTKADVSGEGEVSAYDAALIAQYAVGLITRFPVEG